MVVSVQSDVRKSNSNKGDKIISYKMPSRILSAKYEEELNKLPKPYIPKPEVVEN